MCDDYICKSICCLNSCQPIITPTPSNWVGTIILSSSSSQSAELSAESSHMSYLGLCFFPLHVSRYTKQKAGPKQTI